MAMSRMMMVTCSWFSLGDLSYRGRSVLGWEMVQLPSNLKAAFTFSEWSAALKLFGFKANRCSGIVMFAV